MQNFTGSLMYIIALLYLVHATFHKKKKQNYIVVISNYIVVISLFCIAKTNIIFF